MGMSSLERCLFKSSAQFFFFLIFPRSCFACVPNCFSHVWFFLIPWAVAWQALLSMGFSKQEYWSGLPCPPPVPIFWLGCFLILSSMSCLYILEVNPLPCCFICKYFLQFWGLPFHLVYGFPCAKAFNSVPFVYFCFYFHSFCSFCVFAFIKI